MAQIAVTGATGFVGRALVPRLQAEGHDVRVLIRPAVNHAGEPSGVATIRGDIRTSDVAQTLVDGCDVVIHLAASYHPYDDAVEITVTGTRHLVEAAQQAGVGRLVFVSCLGAEASAADPYYRAKWQAERFVKGAEESLPYTILRPSLIVGPHDPVLGPLAALLRVLPVAPVLGAPDARVQPIDVEDLVRCIIAAATEDQYRNEEISVGGPALLTFGDLVDLISAELRKARPKLPVPTSLLPLAARLAPGSLRSLVVPARLYQFRHGVVASPGIVPSIFHFEPRSPVDALSTYLA